MKDNAATKVIAVLAGLALLGGAIAAWHFLHVDGFIAFLIGAAGVHVIQHNLS